MKDLKGAILWLLVAGLSINFAHGQSNPFDLNQKIQEIIGRKIWVASADPTNLNVPHKAVYQYGLAPVVVGLSPGGAPIGYRLVLLAVVPASINNIDEARVRLSIAGIVKPIAVSLRNQIDSLPGLEEAGAVAAKPDESVRKHFDDYATRTKNLSRDAFVVAANEFKKKFGDSFPKYAANSFLAIGLRPCADPKLSEFERKPRNRSTDRFGKLYGWMKSNGLNTVGQAYILGPKSSFWSISATFDKKYEWHENFPQIVLQVALVNAAKRARRTGIPLSYSTAELAGLSNEAVAHIADVFDSAYAAAVHLPSIPSFDLPGISDEIGRARLTECVRLRGTFDATDAGKCAGFKVSPAIVAACLSGGTCAPPFGGRVNLDSLTINTNTPLAYFAQNAALPRVKLGTISQVAETVNKCRKQGVTNAGYCLVTTSLNRDSKTSTTLQCIQSVRGGSAKGLADCAAAGASKEQQMQIACFQNNSKNYQGLALCAAKGALPQTAQRFIACASHFQRTGRDYEEAAACLGAASGSREAACLANNRDNWQDAALCINGDRIPPQVQKAMHCANTSHSLSSFGVCMVASEGSGEAQRIAACYVEGQGIPTAIAVCLAAKDLTEDQRIVLECAAETNGAPHATAACAGGKLAIREMRNCQGKSFGEENCFGESNELRKIAKRFGIEIGPHSLVADVVNVQLKIVSATTTPIASVAERALPEVVKVLPDPTHPKPEDALGSTVGPIIKVAEDYCAHNCCSPSCIRF